MIFPWNGQSLWPIHQVSCRLKYTSQPAIEKGRTMVVEYRIPREFHLDQGSANHNQSFGTFQS